MHFYTTSILNISPKYLSFTNQEKLYDLINGPTTCFTTKIAFLVSPVLQKDSLVALYFPGGLWKRKRWLVHSGILSILTSYPLLSSHTLQN